LDVSAILDRIILNFQEKDRPNAHMLIPFYSSLIHHKVDNNDTIWKKKIIDAMKKLVPKYLLCCVDMDAYICTALCQPFRKAKFATRINDPKKGTRTKWCIKQEMIREGNELWRKLGMREYTDEIKDESKDDGLYYVFIDRLIDCLIVY